MGTRMLDSRTLELTAEEEAAENAAFEASFGSTVEADAGSVTTDQAAPVVPEETTEPTPAEQAGQAAEEDDSDRPMTKAEFFAAIDALKQESDGKISKVHDRVFGKVGELQQRIDAARATYLSPKAKERLATEFPELAEMLFDNEPIPAQVSAPVQQQAAAPQFDPSVIVAEEVRKAKQELAIEQVEDRHPDWQEISQSADFDYWSSNILPATDREQLLDSWKPSFINRKFDEFKAWKAQQVAAQASKEKTVEQDKLKRNRLESAVTPSGVPKGSNPSIEDEEEAAFRAAFGKRQRL